MSDRSKLTIRLSPDLARSAADGPKPTPRPSKVRLTGFPDAETAGESRTARRPAILGTLAEAAIWAERAAEAEQQVKALREVVKPGKCIFTYNHDAGTVIAWAGGVRESGTTPKTVDVTRFFLSAEGDPKPRLWRLQHGELIETVTIKGIAPGRGEKGQPHVILARDGVPGTFPIDLNGVEGAMGLPNEEGKCWALPLPPPPEA